MGGGGVGGSGGGGCLSMHLKQNKLVQGRTKSPSMCMLYLVCFVVISTFLSLVSYSYKRQQDRLSCVHAEMLGKVAALLLATQLYLWWTVLLVNIILFPEHMDFTSKLSSYQLSCKRLRDATQTGLNFFYMNIRKTGR